MRIVHLEDFFHPDAGYQINILPKYQVEQGHDCIIVTSQMDHIPKALTEFFGAKDIPKKDREFEIRTGVKVIRLPIHGFISGRAVNKFGFSKVIDGLNPDIVYVHGNDTLTAIRFLVKIKRQKLAYPIIMDSHMLEMASVNRFNNIFRALYRKVLAGIIIENSIPVIRTQDDDYVERHLGIPLEQCPWISVGSDTLLFHPNEKVRSQFRKEHKINIEDFVVIYAGKLDENKGGLLLAQAFKNKFSNHKNVVLIVVGSTVGEYGDFVEDELGKSENQIIRFPTQKYTDLAQFYQASDLSVFPRQCSLSFYDAQACGLPVVSENNNINIDRLTSNNGFSFKVGDVHDFREQITRCVEMPNEEYDQLRRNAHEFVKESYDYADVAQVYTDLIQHQLIKHQRGSQSS